jgi:DNA-binding XRE family transcriptional regulator
VGCASSQIEAEENEAMGTLIHRRGPGKGDWYVYGPWGKKDYPGTAQWTNIDFHKHLRRDLIASGVLIADSPVPTNRYHDNVTMTILHCSRIGGRWIKDSDFGPVLKALREKAGMTQEQLADKAGIPVATIRDLEQARRTDPAWSTICKLATGLEVDLNTLAQAAPAPLATGEAASNTV